MEPARSREAGDPADRQRWVFEFSIDGDLRFISHRDTLRLFRRALARAALPVLYSQGFNPHPRLSIPLPRPVGMASEAESIVVEFEQPIDGDEALRQLDQQMPRGITMSRARRLNANERLLPDLVRYRLDLGDAPESDIQPRISGLLESTAIPVARHSTPTKPAKSIDARPYLMSLEMDDASVTFTLRVTGDGTVRPSEIGGLLGLGSDSLNHRIRRLEVQWT